MSTIWRETGLDDASSHACVCAHHRPAERDAVVGGSVPQPEEQHGATVPSPAARPAAQPRLLGPGAPADAQGGGGPAGRPPRLAGAVLRAAAGPDPPHPR